jgi:CspA family cold shock protein
MYIIIQMSFSDPVETNTPGTSSAERMTGRVKWFNNKSGYGFITVTDGPRTGGDIFVHHSAVLVSSQQYKYLVQGEYVEFKFTTTEGGAHDVQAADVSGIKGGKLMCETRNETRVDHPPRERVREHTTPRGRGGYRASPVRPPVQSDDDQVEWLLVKRKRTMPHTASERGRDRGRGRGRRPLAELS